MDQSVNQSVPPPMPTTPGTPWYKTWWFNAAIVAVILIVGLFAWLVYVATSNTRTGSNFTVAPGSFTPDPNVAAEVETDDDPQLGSRDAPVTLVEFGDFECPFCKQSAPIMRTLMVEYGDDINFIYRDFPISSIHSFANIAAQASMCVWEQGQTMFWSWHDRIYTQQDLITEDNLRLWAIQSGAEEEQYQSCVTSEKYRDEVAADLADGINAGVRGTPTFFLNGRKIEGSLPIDTWRSLIDQALTQ